MCYLIICSLYSLDTIVLSLVPASIITSFVCGGGAKDVEKHLCKKPLLRKVYRLKILFEAIN